MTLDITRLRQKEREYDAVKAERDALEAENRKLRRIINRMNLPGRCPICEARKYTSRKEAAKG